MPYEKYQECIDTCNHCAVSCKHCAAACLQEENVSELVRCIALNETCAEVCYLASSVMAAGSEFAEKICTVCAEICEACGEECAKHDHGHCKECADACFNCAKICREMTGAPASPVS